MVCFFFTKGQNILWEADINHMQNIYLQKNTHLIKDFCQLPEYTKVSICCCASPHHMLENLRKQHSYMKFHSEKKNQTLKFPLKSLSTSISLRHIIWNHFRTSKAQNTAKPSAIAKYYCREIANTTLKICQPCVSVFKCQN